MVKITLLLAIFTAFSVSAFDVQKVEKVEKYMGSCELKNHHVTAHLTYVSETGYEDGYSHKGIIVEFGDEKGKLVRLTDQVKRLSITGFENEVKIKNRWNKFTVDKNKNLFGGSEGEIKIRKARKSGTIEFEYKCYQQGPNCVEYEIELELKNCKLDYTLNGKKIK